MIVTILMRTDKELLEVLLENVERCLTIKGNFGLCASIDTIYFDSLIEYNEYARLQSIIHENPRNEFFLKQFYFEPRLVEPRIKYLKELIQKYENR